MRSSYDTLLSIFEWGKIMGVNPWNLSQFGEGLPERNTRKNCQSVWFQHQWQRDYLSREEIGNAIEKAEAALALELHFWPAPKYIEETAEEWNRISNRYAYGSSLDVRYQWNSLTLEYGMVQGGGSLARTAIGDTAVNRTDTDGDGLADRFTATIATSVTDASEIAVYYTATDRMGNPVDETWRIRPVVVTISGGNATITGHACLLAKPELEEGYNADALDASAASSYVTQISVYRVYRDTTASDTSPSQGYALWDYAPTNFDPTNPAGQSTVPVFIGERFAQMGQVYAAYANCCGFCSDWREPDRVMVKYLAGYPRQSNGLMNQMMADIVAHLATAWLPESSCGCDREDRIIAWWRGLPNEGAEKSRLVTFNEIQNTFGERRGASYAYWRMLRARNLGFANG